MPAVEGSSLHFKYRTVGRNQRARPPRPYGRRWRWILEGDGALGLWNDEALAEVAQATARATVALEAAWPPNHQTDDIQQIEAEQADSEQTADESSIESPTAAAPARSWVKPLAVWAPGGSRLAVRQRNAKSALAAGAGATGVALAMRPDKPPEKRVVVLVTAGLMGDPKHNYVRAELRQDEGRSAPVGQDD